MARVKIIACGQAHFTAQNARGVAARGESDFLGVYLPDAGSRLRSLAV